MPAPPPPRRDAPRCDVALWELEPTLLDATRPLLVKSRREQSASSIVDLGELHGRRTAIVSAAAGKPLAATLGAFAKAHRPRHVLLVGAVAGRGMSVSPGDVLLAEQLVDTELRGTRLSLDWLVSIEANQHGFRRGDLGVGLFEQAGPAVTCRWGGIAQQAAEGENLAYGLVGVVTETCEGQLRPPERWRRATARDAGALVGALWGGGVGDLLRRRSRRKKVESRLAAAIGEIVRCLP